MIERISNATSSSSGGPGRRFGYVSSYTPGVGCVGTVAEVSEARSLETGSFVVHALGRHRFRLTEAWTEQQSFGLNYGRIQQVDDDDVRDVGLLAQDALRLLLVQHGAATTGASDLVMTHFGAAGPASSFTNSDAADVQLAHQQQPVHAGQHHQHMNGSSNTTTRPSIAIPAGSSSSHGRPAGAVAAAIADRLHLDSPMPGGQCVSPRSNSDAGIGGSDANCASMEVGGADAASSPVSPSSGTHPQPLLSDVIASMRALNMGVADLAGAAGRVTLAEAAASPALPAAAVVTGAAGAPDSSGTDDAMSDVDCGTPGAPDDQHGQHRDALFRRHRALCTLRAYALARVMAANLYSNVTARGAQYEQQFDFLHGGPPPTSIDVTPALVSLLTASFAASTAAVKGPTGGSSPSAAAASSVKTGGAASDADVDAKVRCMVDAMTRLSFWLASVAPVPPQTKRWMLETPSLYQRLWACIVVLWPEYDGSTIGRPPTAPLSSSAAAAIQLVSLPLEIVHAFVHRGQHAPEVSMHVLAPAEASMFPAAPMSPLSAAKRHAGANVRSTVVQSHPSSSSGAPPSYLATMWRWLQRQTTVPSQSSGAAQAGAASSESSMTSNGSRPSAAGSTGGAAGGGVQIGAATTTSSWLALASASSAAGSAPPSPDHAARTRALASREHCMADMAAEMRQAAAAAAM